MNCFLPTQCRAIVVILTVALLPTAVAFAQPQGYQAPNFSGMAMQASGAAQQTPLFPASLLAGGPAAAQGGEFMDVQGRQIELANYCQSCPGGSCPTGNCGPGGGGYGDPMAVDFGGYGQDQCGPHYFDVQIGAVFLQSEELFSGGRAFTSAGVASPDFFLDPSNDFSEYDAGWEIAARYDVGALAVLEVAYMGLYDLGFSDTVLSPNVAPGGAPFSLVSVFNNYGVGVPIDGIDQGSIHSAAYEADLQSTEINYRRYWVGNNPRVSGTWLLGARYLRFTDQFNFDTTGLVLAAPQTAALQWSGENDMVGFHFGGDAWVCLRQGLRIGAEGTAGIYNNRYKFANSGTFSAATAPDDFANAAEGNQVAFATEADVSMVADILPSWSIRGGYRVMFLNSLVTGAGSIDQSNISAGLASTQGEALFHGFHGGLEYVW